MFKGDFIGMIVLLFHVALLGRYRRHFVRQCPLPSWNRPFNEHKYGPDVSHPEVELAPRAYSFASFVRCSQEVRNNGRYMPVTCMSTSYSFVYVLTGMDSGAVGSLEPSCGYLAMTPLGSRAANASYAETIELMRTGFAVRFPTGGITECLMKLVRERDETNTIEDWALLFFSIELRFWNCVVSVVPLHDNIAWSLGTYIIALAIWLVKCIAVLCRFMLAPIAVLIFLAHKYWKTRITIDAVEKFLLMQQMLGPTRYAYTDITAITNHFRDKLGQGGYGSVFKGVLSPGNVHVAVKMLEGNSNCNGEDFISEVATIGRIHHVNVVRLMGFCPEEMRQALVYEYMPRGSLDKYIFSAKKSFCWDKLMEIALGIARGIHYLHQGCDMQILHFDIKPHNILLDSNFVPKLADFGLAKLYPRDNSFVPSRALRGTIGYIAPEMISRSFGVISSKSDVYSFGMLLLEMAGGRRNVDPNAAHSSQAYYPSWVYDRLTQQEWGEISVHVVDMHELERKLCIVGLWCIQMRSQDRPTMGEVIEMLEGCVEGLEMPSRPLFCDEGHTHTEDTYHLSSELTEISEEDMSENIIV
ncbi:rust resistance kinase Lr10-like [Triticum aestivum]|nr:rust resistance kinase Lr10-like [Triticum aestivum]